ncbi:3-dehydroquinate synthase [Novipirellula artificiosorum]|uniref:3-dehydroquinate synthase n=1 Tax=Novipirellula artificiosorum TaxID=2528016 RepID=A0A5C6D2C9_9BACT|nr:3-dehydroquinate synthase [Novipirellula artificiosorum]TWU30990.1 3-dehydroquinate synthase [Novipirellula artificiosorum]
MLSGSQIPKRQTVEVSLGDRSYPIEIGTDWIEQFCDTIAGVLGDLSHALVITDAAVETPWAMKVATGLAKMNTTGGDSVRVNLLAVPSGETSKSLTQLDTLWQWMLESSTDRRSVVIAVGGGVIGDLAGFAAASFTRGIRFVQIPTTLLAMVDSSVGGKTGINLPTAKNMVGAFWQPAAVLIDTTVMSTLPDRSYISGLAEVVKYGVIDDAPFFEWLELNASKLIERDDEAVRYAIAQSCRSKANVVGEDERETSGRRAILNYGHTFAHAIEATAGYGEVLHGEAVAIGMQMAANLSIELKLCDPDLLQRQTALLKACQLPTTYAAADVNAMLPVMKRDKKVSHGNLRFVLPERIGSVMLLGEIEGSGVIHAIEACR